MARSASEDGAARLLIVDGVSFLRPDEAVFEAMLDGWARQQRGGRRLQESTIRERGSTVRRFFSYTNEYPWKWTAADLDDWMTSLVSAHALAESTIRSYQGSIRRFCDYITSPYYEWPEVCQERFGAHPTQVCHEWNTVAHLVNYEGGPGRRPLTREECQALFDYADDRVERAIRRGRKGALTAYRDATVFKTIYGWGLRCNEASRLETVDLYRNPEAPELGKYASLHVRYGKRTRGSPPKRRMVLTIMPWAAEALEDYLVNIRPRFRASDQPALWITERGGRLKPREIEDRFAEYRDELGLDKNLTPHCLRHSYVTHSIEDGADPTFIQHQVGHDYASTTALYTGVSGDFMNTMMRDAMNKTISAINKEEPT